MPVSTHSLLASALCAAAFGASTARRDLSALFFNGITASMSSEEKHNIRTSETVTIEVNKKLTDYNFGYNTFLRSGDKAGDGVFGQLIDIYGKIVTCDDFDYREGDHYCFGKLPNTPKISDGTDFVSLLPVGKKIFSISHFESPAPAASYLTTMTQDARTGILTVEKTEAMDWAPLGGLWTPCAGSVTPWNTHFGSEEYEPNARSWEDVVVANPSASTWYYQEFIRQYLRVPKGALNKEAAAAFFPYLYGYPWQAKVNADGSYHVAKHYAIGRSAIELPLVMPDKKTVYVTDDGSNVGFKKFVADKPGDLTCGQVYGGQFEQTSDVDGGEFKIKWIALGPKACDHDIEPYLRSVKFYDLFDAADPVDADAGECPDGFENINTSNGFECLKLKLGQDTLSDETVHMLASRLEWRRYGALNGMTTEFNKWEGITFDAKRNRLYTALSDVSGGMEDGSSKDLGGRNDVGVPANKCGCVYYLDLDDDYSAINMMPLICGIPGGEFPNTCDLEGIANPDNVAYIPGHDGLVIGEDTGSGHQNDCMWYYDFSDGSITRFFTTPYGSETTSPYWYPNIRGWAYLIGTVQHPYGESDQEEINDDDATGWYSYSGYMGPFKAYPGKAHVKH